MTKSLVLKMIAALSMTSLVACSGAGSDLTEEEFLAEQESIALEALAEISADDLVDKTFQPTTPRVGDGTSFSLQSFLGNARVCTDGRSDTGEMRILEGGQQANTPRCLFQIIGSDLTNARLVYPQGRLRASGNRRGNRVLWGGGTSFSKVRIVPDGKRLEDGTPTYTILLQNTNRVLDVPGFNISQGTNPVVWSRNGGNNQRWIFRED